MQLSFGVKITIKGQVLTNSGIGLYNDGTNSFFRWITQSTTNVTDTWSSGILDNKWLSKISKSVDIRKFGNQARFSGGSIKIGNEGQFWKELETLSLSMQGFKVEIIEIDLDIAHGGTNANETVIYTGITEQSDANQINYSIRFKGPTEGRISNIAKTITEDSEVDANTGEPLVTGDQKGKIFPLSFGTTDFKRFQQVADKVQVYQMTAALGADPEPIYYVTGYESIGNSERQFLINLSTLVNETNTLAELQDRIDVNQCYIRVVRGTGSGEVRRVLAVTSAEAGPNVNLLKVEVENNFVEELEDNTVSPDLSFVEFLFITNHFWQDFWQCGGYSDTNYYTEENSSYSRLPEYVLEGNVETVENNRIDFYPKLLGDDLKEANGFYFLEVPDVSPYNNNDADIIFDYGNTPTKSAGVDYMWESSDVTARANSNTDLGGDWWSDKNKGTFNENVYSTTTASAGDDNIVNFPYKIKTPIIDSNINNIQDIYILLDWEVENGTNTNYNTDCFIKVSYGPWFGSATQQLNEVLDGTAPIQLPNVNTIPSTWYSDSSDNFFPSRNKSKEITGYSLFSLAIDSRVDFNSLDSIYVSFELGTQESFIATRVKLKQVVLCVNTSNSIQEGIHSAGSGRVWKTDNPFSKSGTIVDPINISLMNKALQNYSQELGLLPDTDGWGLAYAKDSGGVNVATSSDLPIDLSNNWGGYNNSDLNDWENLFVNAQIFDSSKTSTDRLSQNIANSFWLVDYVNNKGEEAISQFTRKSSLSPSVTINLLEIVPDSLTGKTEFDTRDIYCQPFLNYNQNSIGGFDSSLEITEVSTNHTTEAAKAGAVKGADSLSDAEKAELWDRARVLYLQYGIINNPPKTLTENIWIRSDNDALFFMREWFNWMGAITVSGVATFSPKEFISFAVPYEESQNDGYGNNWDIGTRLLVNFPNETDGLDREIMITSIEYNIAQREPIVRVSGVMYGDETADNLTTQDQYSNTTVWDDTFATGDDKEDQI